MRIRDRETEGEGEREKDDAEDADDGNGDDDGGDARKSVAKSASGTPPEAETSYIPFYVKVSHFGNRRNCKSVSPSPLP